MIELETIAQGAVGVGILMASVYNGWQSVQAKREAKNARTHAAQAATNAHPVSNGWGTKVATDLTYLRDGMDRAHRRLDGMDERQTVADRRIEFVTRLASRAAEDVKEKAS